MKKFAVLLLFIITTLSSPNLFAQCPTGNVSLSNQQSVDQFVADYPNCTKISGYLYINGNTINDLSGLSKIKEITSYLYIANTQTTKIDFKELQSVGGHLTLSKNSELVEVDFTQVTTANGNLYFQRNLKLEVVDLTNLITNKGDIYFQQNTALKNINICQLGSIKGYFYLFQNTSLTTICFDNLNKVNGYFLIEQSNLENLNTFKNLVTVGNYLSISDNPSLTSCSGLCNLLNGNGVNGNITFQNNPSACSTVNEVKNSCSALAVENELATNFNIYPNPTNGVLNFNYDLIGANYQISDMSGRVIKNKIIKSNTIDISEFKSGVYYLSIINGSTTYTQKIIKK